MADGLTAFGKLVYQIPTGQIGHFFSKYTNPLVNWWIEKLKEQFVCVLSEVGLRFDICSGLDDFLMLSSSFWLVSASNNYSLPLAHDFVFCYFRKITHFSFAESWLGLYLCMAILLFQCIEEGETNLFSGWNCLS